MSGFDLRSVAAEVREELEPHYQAREKALAQCRQLIRDSANAIRSLHRNKPDQAYNKLQHAEKLTQDMLSGLSGFPDLLFSGFLHDALKEYVEAQVTYGLLIQNRLPLPSELGVYTVTYLHGLAEAVGELRRHMLDQLRRQEFDGIETTLGRMDDIVDLLGEFDYPDGMTANLRRIADVSRSLTERSRADATTTLSQERLCSQLG